MLSLPVINISAVSIIDKWISPLRNHSDISVLELKHQYFTDGLAACWQTERLERPSVLCSALPHSKTGIDKHTFLCPFYLKLIIFRSVLWTRWFVSVIQRCEQQSRHTQMLLSSSQEVKCCLFLRHTSAPASLQIAHFFLARSDLCDMVITVESFSHASKLQWGETENCC